MDILTHIDEAVERVLAEKPLDEGTKVCEVCRLRRVLARLLSEAPNHPTKESASEEERNER